MLPGSSETSSIISDLEVGTLISLIFSILNGFLGLQTEKKIVVSFALFFLCSFGSKKQVLYTKPFFGKRI
jgi:hypothetical protein